MSDTLGGAEWNELVETYLVLFSFNWSQRVISEIIDDDSHVFQSLRTLNPSIKTSFDNPCIVEKEVELEHTVPEGG